jgi:hypothetical protein
MSNKIKRTEQEVFFELAKICCQPGYVHALAYICFKDNVIVYSGEIKEHDLSKMYSTSRLIRSEINTLLGLMIKENIDWTLPEPSTLKEYIRRSRELLEELHISLSSEFFLELKDGVINSNSNPFERGEVWREPIFYSGEAAYSFQYLDLAKKKYSDDNDWLKKNKGFTIEQATQVTKAIDFVLSDTVDFTRYKTQTEYSDEWPILPIFTFSIEEIVKKTKLASEIVTKVLGAFSLPQASCNEDFNGLNDFNLASAKPLLERPNGEFLLLSYYTLVEAIYEAPYYWMIADSAYRAIHSKNRGDFTENFVAERLSLVFGNECVHMNVNIFKNKASLVSDIDVLVIWGDRAIIVQTKSKRLTIEAKNGRAQAIRRDFKAAVQAAYDQGIACANSLLERNCRLVTSNGSNLKLPQHISEIYLLCVISDNYQALTTQARQFLQLKSIDRVQAPLVMDVFALDAITEMLQSPLQLLSYVNRRANYAEKLMASQELTYLGYHLKRNLWVQHDLTHMYICDEFSEELDIAMGVRRANLEGADTPDGILTRYKNTSIGRIVKEIEARPEPATIALGFLLLEMDEKTIVEMSRAIDTLASWTRADGKRHDCTFANKDGPGITFHCTDEPIKLAGPVLEFYCLKRKYKEKASQWFGLCISSDLPTVRFGVSLTTPWRPDRQMDQITKSMKNSIPIDRPLQLLMNSRKRMTKVGRNEPCLCGSGKKYKKCCLS